MKFLENRLTSTFESSKFSRFHFLPLGWSKKVSSNTMKIFIRNFHLPFGNNIQEERFIRQLIGTFKSLEGILPFLPRNYSQRVSFMKLKDFFAASKSLLQHPAIQPSPRTSFLPNFLSPVKGQSSFYSDGLKYQPPPWQRISFVGRACFNERTLSLNLLENMSQNSRTDVSYRK